MHIPSASPSRAAPAGRRPRGARPLAAPAALLASLLLAACGGGGGTDNSAVLQDTDTQAALQADHAQSALQADTRQAALQADTGEAGLPDQRIAALAPAAGPALSSQIVLQLRRDVQIGPLLSQYRLRLLDQFGQRPIYQLQLPAGASQEAMLAALQQDPRVRFAEPNVPSAAPEARNNSVWAIGRTAAQAAAQWASATLGLAEAHAISRGAGVRVAVLDTGIDTAHPALAPRLARRADGSLLGLDLVAGDANPAEEGSRAQAGYGHGTHVAGLVAMAAPAARLMPVRVLDPQGRGNTWVLAEGLGWAVDPDGNPATDDGAHVVNLSLGTLAPTALLQLAVQLATCQFDDDDDDLQDPRFAADRARCGRGLGAVVAAAAGNGGSDVEQQYPAAEDVKGSLSVAASTAGQRVAPFSNWGSWVRIAAPGQDIVSTVPGGGWGAWSGTSMAAPLVAGSAALLLATVPKDGVPGLPTQRQWVPEDVMKRLTDRSAGLCDSSLRRIDPPSALRDVQASDPACS